MILLPFNAVSFELLTASFGKSEIFTEFPELILLIMEYLRTEFSIAFEKKTGLMVNTTVIYKYYNSKLQG